MSLICLGMLRNFSWLIRSFGFIPNGNRLYYTNRSQPPLFPQMVHDYIESVLEASNSSRSDDDRIVSMLEMDFLPALHQEYGFWMTKRIVNLPGQVFALTGSCSNGSF
jgi:alpha,alpha-trehalase